jgi:hypothetical protein
MQQAIKTTTLDATTTKRRFVMLDHYDRIDWDELESLDDSELDDKERALLDKRDEHKEWEQNEYTCDVLDSKDGTSRGYIVYDVEPANPRLERDNTGHMVCWHNRSVLGDKHKFYDPEDFDLTSREWTGDDRIAVILNVYAYEHSGITVSTSPFTCPWDSGQVGYIYLTRGDCLKEWGYKRLNAARRGARSWKDTCTMKLRRIINT